MITEIIFIILTFLITGYGIYRFGREEEPGQQIEVQGNEGVQNDINIPIVQNNDNNNIHINPNININNINNENNENNNTVAFKNQTIGIIERKEEKKNIDWGDLETTAHDIENCFTYEGKSKVQDPLEQIKNILNEEKLKRGEKAVKKWIDRNSGFFMEKKFGEIATQKFGEIATLIYESEENTYMFKNIDTNKEEEKKLLTGYEIIGFLNKIKNEEGGKLINNMSDGEILQKQENAFKELERQVKMKKEKKRREEEEERKKELEEEKKLKEIDRKRKEYDEEAKKAKLALGEEPNDNNPDTCHIKFRLPDGGKILERRFLKDDKISTLYVYAKSLGRKIFTEPDTTDFDIFYVGFPKKNLENSKNNTLEQEGFYPNAFLQISEK